MPETRGASCSVRVMDYSFDLPINLHCMRPIDFCRPLDQLFSIELFAGSANLSYQLRRRHFQTFPIDHTRTRSPRVKLVLLDITKPSQVQVLFHMITTLNVAYFHAAPPCGTSSKAREKPLPSCMSRERARPLRSATQPLGLVNLTQAEKAKVTAANYLYAVTVVCMCLLELRGAIVSCENPTSSYMWPVFQLFISQAPVSLQQAFARFAFVKFQSCMHGGARDKWISFLSTKDVFDVLQLECDGSHAHATGAPPMQNDTPVFPTAQEAAYPVLLCERIADCLVRACQQRGAIAFPDHQVTAGFAWEKRAARLWGIAAMPPLVSEYALLASVSLSHVQAAGLINSLKKGVKRKWKAEAIDSDAELPPPESGRSSMDGGCDLGSDQVEQVWRQLQWNLGQTQSFAFGRVSHWPKSLVIGGALSSLCERLKKQGTQLTLRSCCRTSWSEVLQRFCEWGPGSRI